MINIIAYTSAPTIMPENTIPANWVSDWRRVDTVKPDEDIYDDQYYLKQISPYTGKMALFKDKSGDRIIVNITEI